MIYIRCLTGTLVIQDFVSETSQAMSGGHFDDESEHVVYECIECLKPSQQE